MDKTGWAPGPWIDEPDDVQFVDDGTGLTCRIEWGSPSLCVMERVPHSTQGFVTNSVPRST